MVQEHRHRLARNRQGIRRAAGDRRLFAVGMGRGRIAVRGARTFSQQDIPDQARVWTPHAQRGAAPSIADAGERCHFQRRYRGGSPGIQFRDAGTDHGRRAPGQTGRLTQNVRSNHRRAGACVVPIPLGNLALAASAPLPKPLQHANFRPRRADAAGAVARMIFEEARSGLDLG